MPWEENTFSSMKKNKQPDSVNNKIMIVSLGDYAGPKKKKKPLEHIFAWERDCNQTLEIFCEQDKKQIAGFIPINP